MNEVTGIQVKQVEDLGRVRYAVVLVTATGTFGHLVSFTTEREAWSNATQLANLTGLDISDEVN